EKTQQAEACLAEGRREFLLLGTSGREWGAALCLGGGSSASASASASAPVASEAPVTNPVFVSVGHRLSLGSCVSLVKAVSRHRVPEPIRQADIRSREVVRAWVA
ncbi:unnamed protein product, partial [Discosporangium mesarthrocarpum]